MNRALLAGWTTWVVVSCAGPAASPSAPRVLTPEQRAQAETELAPFQPSFQSLDAALEARDESLARRILDRILARGPQGAALERAQGFQRIVEGREWTRVLEFRLLAQPVHEAAQGAAAGAAAGDQWHLRLLATNGGDADLLLSGAPPTLRVAVLGVDPAGIEQRFSTSSPVEHLERWSLPGHGSAEHSLGSFALPIGTALAVRAVFELEFLPGDVTRDGEVRPASRLSTPRVEVLRLAPFLPTAPVAPEELARYVREELIRPAPLLERAVRIEASQRGRALDLLTPAVLELPSGEVEKVTVALRWLSGQGELGSDARSWRQWLDRRAQARARRTQGPGSALELPAERP
jgi:hypothetical protein